MRGWRGMWCALGPALLAGCATVGEAPPRVAAPEPPAALAAQLPAEVAGFRRGQTLPAGAGQGTEVAYATPGPPGAGAVVELTAVSDGAAGESPESPLVGAAFAQMLEVATRPGPARSVREGQPFLLPVAGAPALRCAETEGRYGREAVEGLVCAGMVRGALLRLWVTMPRHNPPPGDARAFATGIAAALRGGLPG
ncbi:hypothetical protein [Crenalkalicoccus roseus]|uniref:hypothetical protein n=1 Tax=Crenalkalicoccus roseus TaxID=1485588 RepID=UPI0010805B65|nr:hypothetical protein [Crenalkalicoccus roseus]